MNYKEAVAGIRARIIYSKDQYKASKENALSEEIRRYNAVSENAMSNLLILIDTYLDELKEKG